MANMKTASVREIQHNLAAVLAWVESGQEVLVLRRKKVVARLVPAEPVAVESPDFIARSRDIWGDKPKGKPLSEILSEARGKR